MIIQSLKILYRRDLERLKAEIMAYSDERIIWYVEKNIPNSAGNLCLHLVGNLNTYIGAILGNSGYVRYRDLEFSQRDVPRAELGEKIESTINIVDDTLDKLTDSELETDYPEMVFAEKMTTGFFLLHLSAHLNYHLGQINYHRRLLDI